MIVTNSVELKSLINKKTAVALGSFDALHIGHMAVIDEMMKFAKENDCLSLVQLFDKPLSGQKINTLERRLKILESASVDVVVVEKFDQSFSETKYDDFVKTFLKERYNAKKVFAGENYRFGHLAEGDTEKLEAECKKHGIETKILPFVKKQDTVVSSTVIRNLIDSGDVSEALNLMTRPFEIEGQVVYGSGIGHKIDFPTANIAIPDDMAVPKDGVYLTKVILPEESFYGLTNVGAKPTVGNMDRNIETYILGTQKNLYHKSIKLCFLKRIRDIKRFESLRELKKQIEEDKKEVPKA